MISNLNLIRNNFFFLFLFLMVLTLPFGIHLNTMIIISFSLVWLFEGSFKRKLKKLREQPLIWLFSSFYLIIVLSVIFMGFEREGLFQLEKKVSLLVFPVIFGTTIYQVSKKRLNLVFTFFIFGCFLASIICLVKAVLAYRGDSEIFYTNNLTAPLQFHYIYFALYIAFSIILTWHFLFTKTYSRIKIAVIILLNIYFMIFLILLSAKMVIGAFLVSSIAYFILLIWQKGKIRYAFILFSVLISFFIILSMLDVTRDRMSALFIENPAYNPISLRLIHWKCSWQIATSDPVYFLFGVGAGKNEQLLLNECYLENKYWGYHYSYNAHSQYFQTLLNTGMVGLTIFLLMFFIPIIIALKAKNYIYMAFLLLFFVSSLTEALLTVQKGIVFYAIFNSLFAFKSINDS